MYVRLAKIFDLVHQATSVDQPLGPLAGTVQTGVVIPAPPKMCCDVQCRSLSQAPTPVALTNSLQQRL